MKASLLLSAKAALVGCGVAPRRPDTSTPLGIGSVDELLQALHDVYGYEPKDIGRDSKNQEYKEENSAKTNLELPPLEESFSKKSQLIYGDLKREIEDLLEKGGSKHNDVVRNSEYKEDEKRIFLKYQKDLAKRYLNPTSLEKLFSKKTQNMDRELKRRLAWKFDNTSYLDDLVALAHNRNRGDILDIADNLRNRPKNHSKNYQFHINDIYLLDYIRKNKKLQQRLFNPNHPGYIQDISTLDQLRKEILKDNLQNSSFIDDVMRLLRKNIEEVTYSEISGGLSTHRGRIELKEDVIEDTSRYFQYIDDILAKGDYSHAQELYDFLKNKQRSLLTEDIEILRKILENPLYKISEEDKKNSLLCSPIVIEQLKNSADPDDYTLHCLSRFHLHTLEDSESMGNLRFTGDSQTASYRECPEIVFEYKKSNVFETFYINRQGRVTSLGISYTNKAPI